MPTYDLLITEVTRYGTRYCVAGWDINRLKMIRPEPPTANAAEQSKFWSDELAGAGKVFSVGHLVRLEASRPIPHFGYPHATEDRIVSAGTIPQVLEIVDIPRLADQVRRSTSASLTAAFGGGLERKANGKAYVPANFQGPSLGAIELEPENLRLHQETWDGRTKLRVFLNDGMHHYDLSAPSEALVDRWHEVGLPGLHQDLAASERVHLRVGLARSWGDNPCYAQVNGLLMIKPAK